MDVSNSKASYVILFALRTSSGNPVISSLRCERLLDPLDDLCHLLLGVDEAGAADLGVQQLAAHHAHLQVARLAGVLDAGYKTVQTKRVEFLQVSLIRVF